jgi:hypothetical protein
MQVEQGRFKAVAAKLVKDIKSGLEEHLGHEAQSLRDRGHTVVAVRMGSTSFSTHHLSRSSSG